MSFWTARRIGSAIADRIRKSRHNPRNLSHGGGGFGGGGPGGSDYSSPVLGDGKIYYVTRKGEIHVIKPTDKFEQLATNRVTSESEDFSATPAISSGQIFFRSNKHLYCVSLQK